MRINRIILGITEAVCAFFFVHCSLDSNQLPNNFNNNTEEGLLKSSLSRNQNPAINTSENNALVAGNTKFAFKLFQELSAGKNENVFISPYSISTALTMAYAGAKGKTAEEMSATLEFTLPEEKILAGFNYLDLNLPNSNATTGLTLKVVNTAWGQVGYSFEPVYLDKLAANYGAGLQLLDFKVKPEPSRITINTWVADNTNNKVQNLIPQGLIDSNTKLVLTNAIYFFADWDTQFKKEFTSDQMFYRSPIDCVSVKMMLNEDVYYYGEFDDCQAIDLSYKGKRVSMTVFVPEIPIDQFCQGLDESKIETISKGLKNESVLLSLPKFSFMYDILLKDTLVKMGIKTAFSNLADFSGISNESRLSILEVVHKAFIKVDEKGTEAAAATAVIIQDYAMPISKKMNVNKPFVFVIKDNQTGTILFIGKVVNPTEV